MKVVALVSGGKDSCYAMQLCQSYGHEIVALANLYPLDEAVDELDSYMYQTVGHQVITALSRCIGLPLFRRKIQGHSRAKDLRYTKTDGDEVEDLEVLLRAVKTRFPDLGGVSSGAIASDYQRLRVEYVCSRLGLVSLAYMWKQEQPFLLQNMIDSGIHAVLVKVAAMGLDPHKHLGKELSVLQPLLTKLQDLYGCNVCGEGGEYETLTLDSPLFVNAKIILDDFAIELHSADSIAPVGVLHPLKFHLETKSDVWSPDLCAKNFYEEVTEPAESIKTSSGHPVPAFLSQGSEQSKLISRKDELRITVNRHRNGFFALACWKQPGRSAAQEVQDELDDLLEGIEGELENESMGWADVIYIQLFLKDMSTFAKANEKYMAHITEELCLRGVPSRCCVELPLIESGMGGALVEVLAATGPSKQVLHVQSISSWAPSCIGPYSQATLYQNLLFMAGQLGLDPPTMNLVAGDGAEQMLQALRNCEAVGHVFTSSLLNSALSFTVYYPSAVSSVERNQMGDVLNTFIRNRRRMVTRQDRDVHNHQVAPCGVSPAPLVLNILVPALPKGALVEVSPLAHIRSPYEESSDDESQDADWKAIARECYHGQCESRCKASGEEFTYSPSTDFGDSVQPIHNRFTCSPCKGLIVPRQLCRAVSSIFLTETQTTPAGNATIGTMPPGLDPYLTDRVFECVQSISLTLEDASLGWDDVFVFRLYFVASIISAHDLRTAMEVAMSRSYKIGSKTRDGAAHVGPRPTLLPVLGVGETAEMRGVIAIELTASGGMAIRL